MVKSYRWVGWGGGPCDYCVTPSPLTRIWTRTLDLGLTIIIFLPAPFSVKVYIMCSLDPSLLHIMTL